MKYCDLLLLPVRVAAVAVIALHDHVALVASHEAAVVPRHAHLANQISIFRSRELPEPIRDHSRPPIDVKLNQDRKFESPFSEANKNKGAKDFYDVLSEDDYNLRNNVNAPYWVKNAGRNELKRVLAKRKALRGQLTTKEVRLMNKRVWYLFKKWNFKRDQALGPFPQ